MSKKFPTVKKWVCSSHALRRIEERAIEAETIEEIISMPDDAIPQGPKWIFSKLIRDRSDNDLAAVLLERKEHDLWVILTVMVNFRKK